MVQRCRDSGVCRYLVAVGDAVDVSARCRGCRGSNMTVIEGVEGEGSGVEGGNGPEMRNIGKAAGNPELCVCRSVSGRTVDGSGRLEE